MSDGKVFQRGVTLEGDTAGQEFVQEREGWVDTQGYRRFVLSTEMWARTNVTVKIETAATVAGKWNTAATITTGGTTYIQAEENATNKLERFVRWAIISTDVTWAVCFWMGYELKS